MASLREALKNNELPDAYQRLLTNSYSPWYVMTEAILEEVGAESEAWKRMIWFSRILCTAIHTSLQRKRGDAVEEVLHSFMNWLGSSQVQNSSAQGLVMTTANYICTCLREQIALDLKTTTDVKKPAPSTINLDEELTRQEAVNEMKEEEQPVEHIDDEAFLQDIEEELSLDEHFSADDQPVEQPEDSRASEPEESYLDDLSEDDSEQYLPETDGPQDAALETAQAEATEQEAVVTDTDGAEAPGDGSVTPTVAEEMGHASTVSVSFDLREDQPDDDQLITQAVSNESGGNDMAISTLTEALDEAAETMDQPFDQSPGDAGPASRSKQVAGGPAGALIPVGLWLAFHDLEMPTLAKLAIYDHKNKNYLFANKQGLLVRQIGKDELLQLIKAEMVDVAECRKVAIKGLPQDD